MATPYQIGWNANTGGYDTSFWTPEQWQQFGASGGTVGNTGELLINNAPLSTAQISPSSGLANSLGFSGVS